MIIVNDVHKRFGSFEALKGVNMNIGKGEIYGLVGPNGAGKSTIIRHLTGAFIQDQGTIEIDHEPVFENPGIKARIGYIPDDVWYYMSSNTLDMKKIYKGLYPKFDEKIFGELTACFPEINLKSNIRTLSKGMQKQVAFLLTIASRPDVLILDEPVDGLDPVMRRQIWSVIMSDVAERETTVLVSSHNLRELEDVCDHVGIMSHGQVVLERSLDELQGSVTKIQVAFDGDLPVLPDSIQILHKVSSGRVHTLILKGAPGQAIAAIESLHPLIMDTLPLTLEEIFIYEMGGEGYAVKDMLF